MQAVRQARAGGIARQGTYIRNLEEEKKQLLEEINRLKQAQREEIKERDEEIRQLKQDQRPKFIPDKILTMVICANDYDD